MPLGPAEGQGQGADVARSAHYSEKAEFDLRPAQWTDVDGNGQGTDGHSLRSDRGLDFARVAGQTV